MLTRLEIRSFAVIDEAVFCPVHGLNVVSGETGAGKSLLIDAIGLILGQKASKSIIRDGKDSAYVEAVFSYCNPVIDSILNDNGIPIDDDTLIVSRTIGRDGRSVARINGTTVILSVLKEIISELIDIHGQNDTSRLFDTKFHIDMLDRFGGEKVRNQLNLYTSKLKEYKEITSEYKRVMDLLNSSSTRVDYLEYAIKEISDAKFVDGEEEDLINKKKLISALARNSRLIEEARNYICGQDSNGFTAASRLSEALRTIKKISEFDSSYSDFIQRLENLSLEVEALSYDYEKNASDNCFSPDEASRIEKRIGLLYELQSKYGKTINEINDFASKAQIELDEINNANDRSNELKLKRRECEKELLEVATCLSNCRKEFASILAQDITSELNELEMPNAKFYVDFKTRDKDKFFNLKGIDEVTFMFSSNPGQAPSNLALTASGGEASRIMLAIKNILSNSDTVPTLIFDEIDTGVSGRASLAIAHKLHSIGKSHQVLCVSHTAQLACAADGNFLIAKSTDGNNTFTNITTLDSESKVEEVSRLLSGTSNKESIELARELISEFRT
ncbi:MAG: DNA repair protein RecN [Saccharofermentans sp.]|nr:DNA repair protein RecN [Saccharofermentans sp.]